MPFRRNICRIDIGLALGAIIVSGALFADDFPPIRLAPEMPAPLCDPSSLRQENIQIESWSWQLYPDGFIYPTYLAAVQNRLGCAWNYDDNLGWIWDITLGGRAPMYRYGTRSSRFPEGWQLDLEGSVHLRLHMQEQMDMEANDFRFGLPLSYGNKIWQVHTGYYHISSHMGDEKMLRSYAKDTPIIPGRDHEMGDRRYSGYRLNYYREAWLLGFAYRPTESTRVYAEVDYAFMLGELTKPWHFQLGAEYSPRYPARGGWGTPFAAFNARLMQEHNFDGNYTVQTGWQWRGSHNQLFRVGIQYFAGVSELYEFIADRWEHKIGLGVWYDF